MHSTMDEKGWGFRRTRHSQYPRSVSLPQELNLRTDRKFIPSGTGPATGPPVSDADSTVNSASSCSTQPANRSAHSGLLQSTPFKHGQRMLSESRTLDPRRNQPAISELCADLGITSEQDDPLVRSLRRMSVNRTHRVSVPAPIRTGAAQRALESPDILHMVFEQLDAMNTIPHELSQKRRKPMSLRHAQLIHGDTTQATEEWDRASRASSVVDRSPASGLSSCLLVNRTWHIIAKKIVEKRIHFSQGERWRQFVQTLSAADNAGTTSLNRQPQMLVLHKLGDAQQLEIERVGHLLGGMLEWLEFYTCPGVCPTTDLLRGGNLTRVVLPGCSRVTDRTLASIAEHCPRLEYLDLRACELVSDRGLKIIAKYCPELVLVNVGRTRGGELITYKGVKHLARQTKVNTLGLAGCHIDDRAIWELALNRGPHLQRLSLNNCRQLTDASIPRVLGYTPNLTVLEIRGCTQITHMRPLVLFKRQREYQGSPPLIEGCEVIERRLQVALMKLQQEISRQILADCQAWLDIPDTDVAIPAF